MGYTWAILFISIISAPVALVLAGVAFLLARWLGFVPKGGRGILGYLLILCSSYGLLYLAMTVDQLILTPARLQQQYLGARVAGPLSLVGFEAGGFQDFYSIWRYRLSQPQAEALRSRCRGVAAADPRRCSLFSGSDERWDASVELDGNELSMLDGTH